MEDLATHITRERKKRELEPMVRLMSELKQTTGSNAETKAFKQMAHDLHDLTSRIDAVLDRSARSDVQWFLKAASTLLR